MTIDVRTMLGVDTIRGGEPGRVELRHEQADEALYQAKKAGRNRVAGSAAGQK